MTQFLVRKSIAALEAEAERPEVQALVTHDGVPLKRSLSATNLVALGIGAIIGAGIFVLTGQAAAVNAGPAITLSFVLGATACAFGRAPGDEHALYVTTDGGFIVPHEGVVQDAKLVRLDVSDVGYPLLGER